MAHCMSCDKWVKRLVKGRCNPCYKREVWRPAQPEAAVRERESRRKYDRDRMRAIREHTGQSGRPRVAARCKVCNRFKPRPSSVCDYCGDDPVTHGGDPFEYDRAHGWDNY